MFVNNLYDKTYDWLYSIWSGKSSLREIKDTYLNTLHLLQASGAKLLIVDIRQMEHKVQAEQIVNWMRQVWQPEAAQYGLEMLIHIVPDSPADSSGWPHALQPALGIPQFESLEQTVEWIQLQRNKDTALV